jgi:hypothetical protein
MLRGSKKYPDLHYLQIIGDLLTQLDYPYIISSYVQLLSNGLKV